MINLRLWIAGLVLAGAGVGAAAQESVKADTAVTDSVSGAFATVWADYLKQDMPADTESAQKFLEGLNESLNVTPQMEQYFRGVLVGLSVGERVKSMQSMGMPVDGNKTIEMITAFLSGKKTQDMTLEQANEYLNSYVASKMKSEPDTVSVAAEQAFIDGVAKMKGAEVLPSGVVLVTMTDGTGECPLVGDEVMVAYEGRLSDGTVFDSTDVAIPMTVGKLVPGFNQGLLKMKSGGTYRLVIPAEMAYGADGIPGVIPGNAALDFTITLQ